MHNGTISTRSVLKILLIPLILYLVWINRDLVFALFIAFIIFSALKPGVDYLDARGIKRPIAAILLYILFLVTVAGFVALLIPPIVTEMTTFIKSLPVLLDTLSPYLGQSEQIQELARFAPNLTNQFIQVVGGVFSRTFFVITTFVFGFYLLYHKNLLDETIGKYVHKDTLNATHAFLIKAQVRMSSWVWGQASLMFVIGVASYIGFSIIGLKYALPLAILAGLLEAVPNLGPTIAAIPATIIAYSQGGLPMGLITLGFTILLQQVENNLLVPFVMRYTVGINPLVTLICLFTGLQLAGPVGAFVAIPLYLFIETFILSYRQGEFPHI